ncbi:FAD-dependent oxidoreductase [Nonomuraea sp. NPDC050680]|uniref:FAD-dependent oxidoreductase n=1 Tax=Nonomuraea sp. NPDC050680 TaxID=3154630 RepID=UPI0033DF4564
MASEMATAFAALGSSVTMLVHDGVLPLAEPFAGERITESLWEAGVSVRLGAEAASVHSDEAGTVHITMTDGEQVEADDVLVAIGRTPNTQDIGLGAVGLTPGAWLTVDDTLRVVGEDGTPIGGGWLYAAGDVNRRVLLTHQGKYQPRAVGDVIVARAKGEAVEDGRWGRHLATADERAVPQVVFTEPEIASVGLTVAAAEAAGTRIRVVDYDLGAVAGSALHADGYRGPRPHGRRRGPKVIVGCTLVGPDVAELLHAATIAVVGEVALDRLWHAVPAYPTVSEVWLRLLEAYGR